jgi:S-adenosyl-L-methionine hydrolase (adenosine-forming)
MSVSDWRNPVVILMTDFGLRDTYVGQMKCVITSICPDASVIDLTHAVDPQNIAQGAFFLDRSMPFFPDRAVVVCVVDPGVGTSRKPIAVKTARQTFLAPDNGLLTPVLGSQTVTHCISISSLEIMLPAQSATFHGRDIFSPAAAHLCAGFPFDRLGDPVDPASCITLPAETNRIENGNSIAGRVLFCDHFGNLVTSLESSLVDTAHRWEISAEGIDGLPIVKTYEDVDEGKLLAYRGSFDTIEIAVRNGSAAGITGLKHGAAVRLVRKEPVTTAIPS